MLVKLELVVAMVTGGERQKGGNESSSPELVARARSQMNSPSRQNAASFAPAEAPDPQRDQVYMLITMIF